MNIVYGGSLNMFGESLCDNEPEPFSKFARGEWEGQRLMAECPRCHDISDYADTWMELMFETPATCPLCNCEFVVMEVENAEGN